MLTVFSTTRPKRAGEPDSPRCAFLGGAVLVLASTLVGCGSAGPVHRPFATASVAEPLVIAPAAPLTVPPLAVTTSAPPRPALVTNTPRVLLPANLFAPTWVPLDAWGQFNGWDKPQRLTAANAPHPTYRIQSTNGSWMLKAGSRVAQCNGLEVWLGYEPRVMWDALYVHTLDAQRNLQALIAVPELITKSNRVIVLDPGHGGQDSGTRSANSRDYEKNLTLDWALRLRPILEAEGWKVHLTRSEDRDVSLADRVALADRVGADFFLSLHFNSATPNARQTGVETFCLTPVGMPSSLVRDFEDDPKHVFPNNAFDTQNVQIAYRLHRAVLQCTQAADRGVRRARFMGVVRGQKRPAVLIEGGYLSNPVEARKIESAAYRQALAEAVGRALD